MFREAGVRISWSLVSTEQKPYHRVRRDYVSLFWKYVHVITLCFLKGYLCVLPVHPAWEWWGKGETWSEVPGDCCPVSMASVTSEIPTTRQQKPVGGSSAVNHVLSA
jgi:hypothetical protein